MERGRGRGENMGVRDVMHSREVARAIDQRSEGKSFIFASR